MDKSPRLEVHLQHRIGTLDLDIRFVLTQPWTVLFGPSGSGKTTILRAIAGLIPTRFAKITYLSETIDHVPATSSAIVLVDTARGQFVPAHRRGIPFASQQPALFPHMTVVENLRFGISPTSPQGRASQQPGRHLSSLLDLFRITHLAQKRPRQLSGGEAQRVSLARSIAASRDRILLLDEPFTGIDPGMRDELIQALEDWQAESGTPILSVTHDVAEAFRLQAEIIKLANGRIVQQGPIATVLAEERTRLLQQLGAHPQR